VKFTLLHEVVAYDGTHTNPASNQNVWRLYEAYEVDRAGSYNFTNNFSGNPIVRSGAWEFAAKENGAADYVGTYHGDEVLSSAVLWADGARKTLGDVQTFQCKELKFLHLSTIYRCNTESDDIATMSRFYTINNDGIKLKQKITWAEALTLDNAYMVMLPIKRRIADDDISTQITDAYVRDSDWTIRSVGSSGFGAPGTSTAQGVRQAMVWSDTSGISSDVKIITMNPVLANENQFISDALQYNKLYWDFCGTAYVTTPAEVWSIEIQYNITSKN
jgi:hypothetical protein